jgi:hypothetical protein
MFDVIYVLDRIVPITHPDAYETLGIAQLLAGFATVDAGRFIDNLAGTAASVSKGAAVRQLEGDLVSWEAVCLSPVEERAGRLRGETGARACALRCFSLSPR